MMVLNVNKLYSTAHTHTLTHRLDFIEKCKQLYWCSLSPRSLSYSRHRPEPNQRILLTQHAPAVSISLRQISCLIHKTVSALPQCSFLHGMPTLSLSGSPTSTKTQTLQMCGSGQSQSFISSNHWRYFSILHCSLLISHIVAASLHWSSAQTAYKLNLCT